MERLTESMLTPELPDPGLTWETLAASVLGRLRGLLDGEREIASQLLANCEALTRVSPHRASEVFEWHIRYLAEKYAYRILLTRPTEEFVLVARRRARIESLVLDTLDASKGALFLCFHFGHYHEAMSMICSARPVVLAVRPDSRLMSYRQHISRLSRQFGVEPVTKFESILQRVRSGYSVVLFADNARWDQPHMNQAYQVAGLRLFFNGATDELIRRSDRPAYAIELWVDENAVCVARLSQVDLSQCGKPLQTAFDTALSPRLIDAPWLWDRLKYLDRLRERWEWPS